MKCKYEIALDKLERWLDKKIERNAALLPTVPLEDVYHIVALNNKIAAYNNVKSILINHRIKASKMKI